MRDRRLDVFHKTTTGLIESLDAVVRLARWGEVEAPPEPLVAASEKLVDRLGAADRLSSGKFNGNIADANRVKVMCAAMKRLDAAYLAYREELVTAPADAATTLELEIGATKSDLESISA
jgi:hypothetical protein